MTNLEDLAFARKVARMAHPVFVENGWTYFDTAPDVPTIERLTEVIYNHLEDARKDEGIVFVSGGRLRVVVEREEGLSPVYGVVIELGETE